MAVASSIGGEAGHALVGAAKSAFVQGLHTTSVVAACFAGVGALIVLTFLPARRAPAGQPACGRGPDTAAAGAACFAGVGALIVLKFLPARGAPDGQTVGGRRRCRRRAR